MLYHTETNTYRLCQGQCKLQFLKSVAVQEVRGRHVAKVAVYIHCIHYVNLGTKSSRNIPEMWASPSTLQNNLISGECTSRTCSVHVYENEHAYLGYAGYLPVSIYLIPRKDQEFHVTGPSLWGNRHIQPKLTHLPSSPNRFCPPPPPDSFRSQ